MEPFKSDVLCGTEDRFYQLFISMSLGMPEPPYSANQLKV